MKSAVALVMLCTALSLSASAADKSADKSALPPSTSSQVDQVTIPPAILPAVKTASVTLPPRVNRSNTESPIEAVPAAVLVKPAPVEVQHNFFDLKNSAGLAALAAGLTGDALSTQKGLGRPGFHEMNPIARPFVQSRAGAAVYSAASFAFMGGGMYLAHRTHHHKLERILPFAIAGWEGFLAARNYHLISKSTVR